MAVHLIGWESTASFISSSAIFRDLKPPNPLCFADDHATRFHAWQSSLLFTVIFVSHAPLNHEVHSTDHAVQLVHLIFSWSSILSWIIFVIDIGLIGLLSFHAYQDGIPPFPITPGSESTGSFLKHSGHVGSLRNSLLWGVGKLICGRGVDWQKRR